MGAAEAAVRPELGAPSAAVPLDAAVSPASGAPLDAFPSRPNAEEFAPAWRCRASTLLDVRLVPKAWLRAAEGT